MNRASVILGIALVVAAIASSREPPQSVAIALEHTVQSSEIVKTGSYIVPNGMAKGLAYSLRFVQPNAKMGGLASGQFLVNTWNGFVIDRESTAQVLNRHGIWDSIAEGTKITLNIPDKDIAQVEVQFDPNTVYDKEGWKKTDDPVYSPQSIHMLPNEKGELHSCTFPVSFASIQNGENYHQLFCIITIIFQDGNRGEIGLALKQIL